VKTCSILFVLLTLAACRSNQVTAPVPSETADPQPTYDERGCLNNHVEIKWGLGCFVYHDNGDNTNRPVRVWYYRPDNFPSSNSKIVFAMHGSERNAEAARDYWLSYADRYEALLVTPEFSTNYYPDADDYNRGFVKDGGGTGKLRNRNDWTFLTVEEIFDVIRAQIPGAPTKYSIGGNSAAGQFISRLAWTVPEARFETASGSNGGWYTLPTRDEIYPNGIGDLPITDADIEGSYAKNFVLPIGELDTDPNSYDLEHDKFTDSQGLNRYVRAHFYYDYTKADAQARGVPYNWHIRDVLNTGHPAAEMAYVTALAMFEKVYKLPHTSLLPTDDTYVRAGSPTSNFGSSANVEMDGGGSSKRTAYLKFNLLGIQPGDFDVAALKIWINDDSPDTYSVRAVLDNSWTESALTGDNAPVSEQEIGSTKGGFEGGYLYIVITDYVKTYAGSQISLSIESTGGTNDLVFFSKEASDKHPVLEFFSK